MAETGNMLKRISIADIPRILFCSQTTPFLIPIWFYFLQRQSFPIVPLKRQLNRLVPQSYDTSVFGEPMSYYGMEAPQSSLFPDCPYRHAQEQLRLPVHDYRPFYRIIRWRESGRLRISTMVDTYDGTTMIDATQLEACAQECICRKFQCPSTDHISPLEFIVSLDVGQTKLCIRSDQLRTSLRELGVNLSGTEVTESELLSNLSLFPNSVPDHDGIKINSYGLHLLNNYLSIFCGTRDTTDPCTPSVGTSPRNPVSRFSESLRINQTLDALEDSFRFFKPVRLSQIVLIWYNADCICSSIAANESSEEELIRLIGSGSHVNVCSLLDSIQSTFSHRVFNPDAVVAGRTALIVAIRHGNYETIKRLISAGADVNTIAPCGTPLSVATRMRSKDTIKLLLEQGADPELTKILLKSHDSSPHQRRFQFLADIMDQCKEEARRSNIAQLHHNFREEYRKIARAAHRVSLDRYEYWKTLLERNALLDWKRDVDNSAEAGWRTGLRMLRKLCNRTLPRNVNEVIMGIALARSMAVILGKEIDDGILQDLNEDLSRWQVLFTDEARFAFSDAVRRIWGVHLADPFGGWCSVAEEIFQDFQKMAEQLMEKAHDVFGLGKQTNLSESDWDRDGGSSRDTGRIRHDQDSRLGDHLMDKQQYAFDRGPDQTTLIWLMAGVVFACCIAVLLVLHCTQASTDVPTNYYGTITKAVFFASVGHILEHEQDLPDVRNGFIEDEVRESISHGTILSVSALKRSVDACSQNWMMSEPERHRLLRGCDDWSNFNQMQISRGVIELYLQQISSATAQSGSNADSPETEQLQEATSSADAEMSSFQFSASNRPSKEQHTPSLDQETPLQSDLDNSHAAPRVNSSHRAPGRKLYACDICSHLFNRSNLKKHKQDMHNPKGKKTHKCTVCGRGFGRDDNRRHHEEKKHGLRFEDQRKQRRRSG